MGLFYTGKGDKGKSVVGKKKIDKTCVEIEALGALDELNSLIGLVKNEHVPRKEKKILGDVQESLFMIQANLAHFMYPKFNPPKFSIEKVRKLEEFINQYEIRIKPGRGFIIPGVNRIASWFDYLRAVSRRTERSVLIHAKKRKIAPEINAYLNRLSSLFFAMARMAAKTAKKKESHPRYQ